MLKFDFDEATVIISILREREETLLIQLITIFIFIIDFFFLFFQFEIFNLYFITLCFVKIERERNQFSISVSFFLSFLFFNDENKYIHIFVTFVIIFISSLFQFYH